jgi:DUF4097 and DUF4098 domain-containing protein YvlB
MKRRTIMSVKQWRNSGIILMGLLFALAIFPVRSLAEEKYTEKFEKTEALAKDGKVFLSNVSGDVELLTWTRDEVKIDATKVAEASSLEKAKEDSKLVTIEVSKVGNGLRIETRYPEHLGGFFHKSLRVSVNYKLWIPEKAMAEIKEVSGDIIAEGVGGALIAKTVSGNVEARKATAGVECDAVSGDLKLFDIVGDVNFKTVSGGVVAERIKGSIEGETVSGDIELREVSDAAVVKAKVLSGNLTYEGKINPQGRYTLNSHSGDVTMILPADSGFEFEASSFSGDIDSDFQIEVSGKVKAKEIHGVVNKGGALIKLSAFSGDIKLKKR